MTDIEFINTFNKYYPFERYIVKTPKSINNLFDDLLLIELFVPNTKLKPIFYDKNGSKDILYWTKFNRDEIYIKVKGVAGEAKLAYFDFADHIRETIREIVVKDMGFNNWQSLYVEEDNLSNLKEMLNKQKSLIELKYEECKLKKDTPNNKLL